MILCCDFSYLQGICRLCKIMESLNKFNLNSIFPADNRDIKMNKFGEGTEIQCGSEDIVM